MPSEWILRSAILPLVGDGAAWASTNSLQVSDSSVALVVFHSGRSAGAYFSPFHKSTRSSGS